MVFRRLLSTALLASFAPVALGLGGCGGSVGTNAASQVLKKPELPEDAEAKCSVRKSQTEPLIVEWPNAARGRLESQTRRGLIAIRYEGCELTQLPACSVKTSVGPYAYWPITRKQSRVVINNADELYASMPVGAVKLEGKLKSAGQLDVNMTIVGRYEAPTHTVFRGDLEGTDCDKATHVIAALTVGAFTFGAGADAEVGGGASLGAAGAGGKSTAKRETLQTDGDEAACTRAQATDKGPPEGCGALLQIEVMTLTKGARPTPVAAPVAVAPLPPVDPPPPVASNTPPKATKPPKCKKGERVEDGACVKIGAKKPPAKAIAGGTVGTLGVGGVSGVSGGVIGGGTRTPTCSTGQHLENNRCVEDAPPPPPPEPIQCAEGMKREGDYCVNVAPTVTRTVVTHDEPEKTPKDYEHAAKPAEEGNPWRTLFFYTAMGGGIAWSAAGLVALNAASEVKDLCSETSKTCTAEGDAKKSTAMTAAIISDVGLGIAALSLLGFFLVPATVKVGVVPTKNGVMAGAGWRFW